MMLSMYQEGILEACDSSENFYVAGDTTNNYHRHLILNLKEDITFSIDIKIDYDQEVLISKQVLHKSYLRSASPVQITFKYAGQEVYIEKGYYAVFESELYGIFIPSDFSTFNSIVYDRYAFYNMLNDVILDCMPEYNNILQIENKQITKEEWSWING